MDIILASRSGKTRIVAKRMVENLKLDQRQVEICKCDASIEAGMRLLISYCAEIMPPIGDVIHSAYVNKVSFGTLCQHADWIT